MATRTFLTTDQSAEALAQLKAHGPMATSKYVADCLEKRFAQHANWQKSRPVRLGSWARGELTAKSDIDLLFIGPEEVVSKLVGDFQREGVKIRARVPEDLNDWAVGVEAFDILALLSAECFFAEDAPALAAQVLKIEQRGVAFNKKLFSTMMHERRARAKRYDSIANFLEPNLKYGAGGLRDLEQGLNLLDIFSDKFRLSATQDTAHEARKVFTNVKEQLLACRHYLHLNGAQDTVVAPLQGDLAQFFSYSSAQKMMSALEHGLAQASFYSDWAAEVVQSAKNKLIAVEGLDLSKSLEQLYKNPSLLLQAQFHEKKWSITDRKKLGRLLQNYFNAEMSDDFLLALFRSQILSQVVPHLKRLAGHVQHDQYHRYSADAHAIQAVREVLRIRRKPKILGRMSPFVKSFTSFEWEVLVWAALYHDLGKGLKGDHSTEGAEIAKKDFISLGLSLKLTAQVAWLVKNHLLMSSAAFRQNPHAQQTWSELFRRGVKGRRIAKLAVLTAIDIRATNPEAWNDWKEKLLYDLAVAMQSPKASRLSEFLEKAEKRKLRLSRDFIEHLDSRLLENLPLTLLLQDIEKLQKKSKTGSAEPLIVKNRQRHVWLRFHEPADRPGLFKEFVERIYSTGAQIQEAYVQTDSVIGAYDWFKIKTTMATPQLKKALMRSSSLVKAGATTVIRPVQFEKIKVVTQTDTSVVISFRGRDQKGALLAAAQALYSAGLEIESAQVHTWGRQIDDVFTVKKPPGEELSQLVQSMLVQES